MKVALLISIGFNIFFLCFCMKVIHYCNILKEDNELLNELIEDLLENDTDYIN